MSKTKMIGDYLYYIFVNFIQLEDINKKISVNT